MAIQIFKPSANPRIPTANLRKLIRLITDKESSKTMGVVSIVFLNDRSMRALNKKFLRHDYVTDVISFDLSSDVTVDGEIYICLGQAARQAKEFNVSFSNEILRLAAHGMLHILGYDDHTASRRKAMLTLGDHYMAGIK